jgi:hypothetical protein
MALTEKVLAWLIAQAVEEYQSLNGEVNEQVHMTWSFAEKGLMTRDEGCVILFGDGSEFQVTVQQSRQPTSWNWDDLEEEKK